ncbi:MAG: hypothetical protein E6Z98_02765, partial [Cutibacterium avidum]|nr:hypothetical protein [Cutibacterium avidum]
HTNPNPAKPAESEPASKTSRNQTTTRKQRPDQLYQINPGCQIQESTRETTLKKTIRQFQPPPTRREPAEA